MQGSKSSQPFLNALWPVDRKRDSSKKWWAIKALRATDFVDFYSGIIKLQILVARVCLADRKGKVLARSRSFARVSPIRARLFRIKVKGIIKVPTRKGSCCIFPFPRPSKEFAQSNFQPEVLFHVPGAKREHVP